MHRMGEAAMFLNETIKQYQKERVDLEWLNEMEEKLNPTWTVSFWVPFPSWIKISIDQGWCSAD